MTVLRLGEEWTTRLDCIDLVLRNTTGVPVSPTTWGRIKALYTERKQMPSATAGQPSRPTDESSSDFPRSWVKPPNSRLRTRSKAPKRFVSGLRRRP